MNYYYDSLTWSYLMRDNNGINEMTSKKDSNTNNNNEEEISVSSFKKVLDGMDSEQISRLKVSFTLEEESDNWYDSIPNRGVLCYVSDSNSDPGPDSLSTVRVIKKYDRNNKSWCDRYPVSFKQESGTSWRYAVPVEACECYDYMQ